MSDIKNVIQRVKKLEIETNRLVEGLIAGSYKSVFKGRGIEFSDVRNYIPGDDTRTIDWNVTARMNAPFIKEFIEERNLTMFILFDISASNMFGYKKSKIDMGIEIAASLMFAAIRNNDNVGMGLFTNKMEKFIPARKGKKHVLRILREMLYYKATNKRTDLSNALTYISKVIKKRAVIFIISDFLTSDFQKPLKILKNRHDIILININDPKEISIPDIGYILLEDGETGEQELVNTSDKSFRKNHIKLMKKKNNELVSKMKKLNIDIIQLKTGQSFQHPLRKFFDMRKKRTMR